MKLKEDSKYIYVSNECDIKDNFKEIYESKYGSNSSIYLYNKKLFLKVFNEANTMRHLNELELLSSLKNLSLAVPKKFLFINELFYGYSMEQKYGTTFYKLNTNTNLKNFLIALKKIEKDLKVLSKNHFVATDLNVFNVLFDTKRKFASLVDCDGYFYSKEDSIESILLYNMYSLYSLVLYTISNIFQPSSATSELFKYMNNVLREKNDYSTSIDQTFNYFIDLLKDESDMDIKTVGDFRKVLRLEGKY